MFALQDMVVELAVVAVVLLVILLSASVLAATCREWLEGRRARESRARQRQRVWRDYAAACTPAESIPATVPVVAVPSTGASARTARDQRPGFSAGPAKA